MAVGSSPSNTFVPKRDRHRSLGVRSQRVTAHTKRGGFLLNSARIGQDRPSSGLKREEIDVTEWLTAAHAGTS